MIVLGLTGGPGTGKSLAAHYFESRGALILSGDEAGKEVVEKNSRILRKLISQFGNSIIYPDGKLNRSQLGKIVFQDREALAELNAIIHPGLLKLLKSKLIKYKKINRKLIVIDAALIYEWRIANWCDYILVVTARRDIRLKRLMAKGLPHKQAVERIASQMPDREKAALADFVIKNNGSKRDLKRGVDELYFALVSQKRNG